MHCAYVAGTQTEQRWERAEACADLAGGALLDHSGHGGVRGHEQQREQDVEGEGEVPHLSTARTQHAAAWGDARTGWRGRCQIGCWLGTDRAAEAQHGEDGETGRSQRP